MSQSQANASNASGRYPWRHTKRTPTLRVWLQLLALGVVIPAACLIGLHQGLPGRIQALTEVAASHVSVDRALPTPPPAEETATDADGILRVKGPALVIRTSVPTAKR